MPESPEQAPRPATDIRSLSLAVLAGIGIVMFLRFAQSVVLPLVISVLISYALGPIVSCLRRWSIPRPVGAGLLLAVLVVGAGAGAYALMDDAMTIVEEMPAAASKIREALKATRGDETSMMGMLQKAATEVENATSEAMGPDTVRKSVTRVQVEEKPVNVGDYLWRGGAGIFSVASAGTLVLFLVYFMLATGDLFRRKLMLIAGPSVLSREITRQAIDEMDTQIGRYMLVQAVTSILVGVTSGIVFWLIGLEHALLWGIAVGLLDTIPYFGPVIVMAGLLAIGYLQFGTILMSLAVAGAAGAIMSLEGVLLTPWLTMRAVPLNGVALFLGLMFWGWMWGIWGLLIAVPMMVIIKSIGDRVEALQPLSELLGP